MNQEQVDLVVSDLNMPIMDGLGLLKEVKASPSLERIPVMVISSLTNAAREAELQDSGVHAVLKKPLRPALLYRAVCDAAKEVAQ